MNRQALALAVLLIPGLGACGASAIIERSAPERPAWVEVTPAARDSLYFVGICSDLPSYQEALRCARAEAMTDVAAWVGARFSSHVYSAQSEATRAGSATSYFDSDLFLVDARRTDSYYEVTEVEWGRSYYVSALYAYPRRQAEAEKDRIEWTTVEAQKAVDGASLAISLPLEQGQWGDAMNMYIDIVERVASSRNLQRQEHIERLAGVAEELVEPLELAAWVVMNGGSGATIEADVKYKGEPAVAVPLQCLFDGQERSVKTDPNGRAVCDLAEPEPGSKVRVTVRPDIARYLEALPDEASGLAPAIGRALDDAVLLEVGQPLTLELSIEGLGSGCESVVEALERALGEAGVQVVEAGKGVTAIEIGCEVAVGERSGDLQVATARGRVALKGAEGRASVELEPVRGLGATRDAARLEALDLLGRDLSVAALKLLRENDGKDKR